VQKKSRRQILATIFFLIMKKQVQPFVLLLHLYCCKRIFPMKFLTAIFLLLIPLLTFSQNYKLNQRYPGYFINAKSDTIRGWILLINKLDNQVGGEYSNDSRAEKIKIYLLPDEIKGFKVQDRIYTALEYGDADPKSQHFLLTLAQGELNLYQYFRLPKDLYVGTGTGQRAATGDDEQYLQSEFIIINQSGKQFVISNQNSLMKNAEEIFGSEKDLLQKILDKEKEYHIKDLKEIVTEFNQRKG
jgi:hypothetical protein